MRSEQGSAPVVSLVLLMPLLALLVFGLNAYSQMADIANVTEEAARGGARWLALHPGDWAGARMRATEVIQGSFTPMDDFTPETDVVLEETADGYAHCTVNYRYRAVAIVGPATIRGEAFFKQEVVP
ncbi:MAG: hypothetical protein QME76_07170 [Bacillota bacterium]|nr:hypothetical protein [Bacillota bacterium]